MSSLGPTIQAGQFSFSGKAGWVNWALWLPDFPGNTFAATCL